MAAGHLVCALWRSEEAKTCDERSTFVKIELNEFFVHLPERFAIEDYEAFKPRELRKGLQSSLSCSKWNTRSPIHRNFRMAGYTRQPQMMNGSFIKSRSVLGMEGKEYKLKGKWRVIIAVNFPIEAIGMKKPGKNQGFNGIQTRDLRDTAIILKWFKKIRLVWKKRTS